jgi:bifunctional non-homologous end joining protein LigD
VIVDGEIIAIRGGRPDFGLLQTRMHVRRPPGRLLAGTPVYLYLFDVLHAGDESLLGLPSGLAISCQLFPGRSNSNALLARD